MELKSLIVVYMLGVLMGAGVSMILTAKVAKHKVLQEVCAYYNDSLDGQAFCYTELNDYLKEGRQ